MHAKYPHLFQPFEVKGVLFRNRLFSAPNQMCNMDASGMPTPNYMSYIAQKARGGAAVVTIGDTPVDREHAATNADHSFNLSHASLTALAEIAMVIHEGGAVASFELNHAGRVANPAANFGGQPWGPVDEVRPDGVAVHGMTEAEMNEVANHYADCAALLKTAGFDMCLLHGGHGWLLDQFLSPLWNTRADEYGGSLFNRAKFPLMVLDRIRSRVGDSFLIEYRMSVCEEIEGGLSKEEGVAFAQMLDGKADFIHCSAGMDPYPEQAVRTHPTIFLPHGVNVHYAAAVKASGVKTPVVAIGAISTPEQAEAILASGQADIVAMARALIADPFLPRKAMLGQEEDIRPCMRCLDCLCGMHTGEHFQCSANPSAGRELRYRNYIQPATVSRKVLVVGGGPAGMEAAVTAAQRGHTVTLAERSGSLGGLLNYTDRDPLKEDLRRMKDYLIGRVERSPVNVLLSTEVTPCFVREGGYDAVIVATGSTPLAPPIPGLDGANVFHVVDAPVSSELGKRIAVLGGGTAGCEAAVSLAREGHEVTLLEMGDTLAPTSNWMSKEGMVQAMDSLAGRLDCRTGHTVRRIENGGVYATDKDGTEHRFEADSVLYAFGQRRNNELFFALTGCAPEVVCVGDAKKVGTVRGALFSGFWAAVNLG